MRKRSRVVVEVIVGDVIITRPSLLQTKLTNPERTVNSNQLQAMVNTAGTSSGTYKASELTS